MSQVSCASGSTEKQVSQAMCGRWLLWKARPARWQLKLDRCSQPGMPLQQLITLLQHAETFLHLNFLQRVKSPRNHSHLVKAEEQPPSQMTFLHFVCGQALWSQTPWEDSQPRACFQVRSVFITFPTSSRKPAPPKSQQRAAVSELLWIPISVSLYVPSITGGSAFAADLKPTSAAITRDLGLKAASQTVFL